MTTYQSKNDDDRNMCNLCSGEPPQVFPCKRVQKKAYL